MHRKDLRQLFADDPDRFAHFSLRHSHLLLDFSKQRVTLETLQLLHALANDANITGWQERMLAGELINHTENRAVLHMALRADSSDSAPGIARHRGQAAAVLERMDAFCTAIHNGEWRGYSGERITDIVNFGIGGSDLGPRMACEALAAWQQPDLRVHFVANADAADLARTLSGLNPRQTLFIVASKTFSTRETLLNAHSARQWLLAASQTPEAVARHFVAVSSQIEAACAFGIAREQVFELWDWVGGRFSLWSAIGLPLALAIGFRNFTALLAGARAMDTHFRTAPAQKNLPLTLALLDVWNTNFLAAGSHAILPYSYSLAHLPAYLQQLIMESLGKTTGRDREPVGYATAPIVWGSAGTNGQHSFFQHLHQGTQLTPCDFIALGKADYPLGDHHRILLANCLAQSSALAFGQTAAEARAAGIADDLLPYRTFAGNQPSTTLLLDELSPTALGELLALYEHKVFCLGVLWNLNAFDQWGVELGKHLATRIEDALVGKSNGEELDASTRGLIAALQQGNPRA